MPDYSKASRGLFVLVEVGRVFTANAISPSECSRQLLARDAIRAGRNFKLLYVAIKFRLYLLHSSKLNVVWRIVVEDFPGYSPGLPAG